MSMQTKQQSMGYILKAIFDYGINTSDFGYYYYKIDEIVSSHLKHISTDIDNYTTYDFMIIVFRESDIPNSEGVTSEVGSNLTANFDLYTVEEAEEFHDAIRDLLRI